MNTKQKVSIPVAIGLGAVAIAVAGGAGYLLFGRNVEAAPTQVKATGNNVAEETAALADMKAKGKETALSAD